LIQVFLQELFLMSLTKVKKSKPLFVFLRIVVVAVGVIWGIYWVSQDQRWERLSAIFRSMNLWVFAAALGIFIIGQLIVGLRWWLLLRAQSIFIDLFAGIRLHFLGLFYNNFMPSSIGGDLIRAWYVTKHTDKKFAAALSVFVDRVIGLLSTLIIAGFFYSVFLWGKRPVIVASQSRGFFQTVSEHKWLFVFVGVILCAIFLGMLPFARGRKALKMGWLFIRTHGARAWAKLSDAIVIYCSKPGTIAAVFGLTVFLQILVITGFWFLGRNLGIEASVKYYYVFFTLTWVLGAVPVSIGGAVVVEGMLAYMFIHLAGVEAEAAVALALCQRIVWMLASLPGAVIHLTGIHLPKDFLIDYKGNVS
jgi:uncharacterized protein (TIRG00374 family)